MPKVGNRAWNYSELGAGDVSKNAPFGNTETPNLKYKIIGGKKVPVTDTAVFKHPDNFQPAETSRRSGVTESQDWLMNQNSPRPASLDDEFPRRGRRAINPYAFTPSTGITPRVKEENVDINEYETKLETEQNLTEIVTQPQEDEFKNQLRDELEGFELSKLKEVYLELAGYDHNMSGYVKYDHLGLTLLRSQMHITPKSLSYLAIKFASPNDKENVNYEKLLSFVSTMLNNDLQVESPRRGAYHVTTPLRKKASETLNPREKEDDDKYSNPFRDRNDAKLLQYIEEQLMQSGKTLDFERIWGVFTRADRDHRGKLSSQQLQDLIKYCDIPLASSVVDRIISKCDRSNGQYDWQQFLEFIERVQPLHTGLNIPESKKPKEYVINFPSPSRNWPKEADDTNIDIRRNEIKFKEKSTVHPPELWFERFMKMAQDLYDADEDATGFLAEDDMVWLLQKNNNRHNLDMSRGALHGAVTRCKMEGKVAIDPLLKILSLKQA